VSVSQCVFPSLVQGALTKPLNSTLARLCIKIFPFIASPPALSHQTDREAQRGLHPDRLCRWKVLWSTRSTSCLPFSGAIPPNPQLIPRRRREHAGKACCHPEWVSLYPFYIHPFVAGWGPKVVVWLLLILVSWFVPNGFFTFWGDWIAPLGASSSVSSSSSTLPTRGRRPASRTGKTPTRISAVGPRRVDSGDVRGWWMAPSWGRRSRSTSS